MSGRGLTMMRLLFLVLAVVLAGCDENLGDGGGGGGGHGGGGPKKKNSHKMPVPHYPPKH